MSAKVLGQELARQYGQEAADASGRRRAVGAMVGGGVVTVLAALLATVTLVAGGPDVAAPDRSGGSDAVVEATFPDVGIAANIYEPGHSSGWHTHPGLHSAVVLAGTLTVYEADCTRHDYGPGDTYLGGRDPHVARNDTAEPVRLVVTFVFAKVGPLDHATVVNAPAGCEAR